MELASAAAILFLMLALSAIGFVALFSRARPLYVLGALVAVGVLGWQAASSFRGVRLCIHLQSVQQFHQLDLATNGEKTIRIDQLPEAQGLQAHLVPRIKGSTFTWDPKSDLWRARDSAGPIQIELAERFPRLFDVDWHDGFGKGDRTWVELTYKVDDSSRAELGEVEIMSMPCRDELMWSDFAQVQFYIMSGFFSLSALGAAAGAVAQVARRFRTRRQAAGQSA